MGRAPVCSCPTVLVYDESVATTERCEISVTWRDMFAVVAS